MKKNLSNELVIEKLIKHFNSNRLEQQKIATSEILFNEVEPIEYQVHVQLIKEVNKRNENDTTMVLQIEENGEEITFPIGWNYTEGGARRKAKQLAKMIGGSKFIDMAIGEKNTLRSWGWDIVYMADIIKSLDEL